MQNSFEKKVDTPKLCLKTHAESISEVLFYVARFQVLEKLVQTRSRGYFSDFFGKQLAQFFGSVTVLGHVQPSGTQQVKGDFQTTKRARLSVLLLLQPVATTSLPPRDCWALCVLVRQVLVEPFDKQLGSLTSLSRVLAGTSVTRYSLVAGSVSAVFLSDQRSSVVTSQRTYTNPSAERSC